jgi:CRISPR-associated DxTHG motif protein
VEVIPIESAQNEEQIWSVFDSIYNSIGEDEDIIFDITHSFRSIPLLAITIINYAKTMKNCCLYGIYYGSYEGAKEVEDHKIASVVDLTIYDEILEWTNAANVFIKYGNSAPICDLEKKKYKTVPREKKGEWNTIDKVVSSMKTLYDNMATCRGGSYNPKASIKGEYANLLEQRNNITGEAAKEIKPMYHLLDRAIYSYDKYWKTDNAADLEDYEIGLGVVEWSIQNGMTQQGYTALEETIKTFLCYKFGLDGGNKKNRDDVDFAITAVDQKDNGILHSYSHMFDSLKEKRDAGENQEELVLEKSGLRLEDERTVMLAHLEMSEGKKEGEYFNCMLQRNSMLEEKCKDLEKAEKLRKLIYGIPLSLFALADKVKDNRNDINHLGFRQNALPSENLNKKLKEFAEEFEIIIEEWGRDVIKNESCTNES